MVLFAPGVHALDPGVSTAAGGGASPVWTTKSLKCGIRRSKHASERELQEWSYPSVGR